MIEEYKEILNLLEKYKDPNEGFNIRILEFDNLVIPFFLIEKVGECICCGGTIEFLYAGSVMKIICDTDDKNSGLQCKFKNKCNGVKKCLNKEKFNNDIQTRLKEIIYEFLKPSLETFGTVYITSRPESREVVVERFLDLNYIIEIKRLGLERILRITENSYINWCEHGGNEPD